jgi:hypothetical protein
VERDFLIRTGNTHPDDVEPKTKKYRYTDSWVKSKFKFGNEDVVMRAPPSIDGFTNTTDFYVEDVTERWGALSGAVKEEANPYDENIGLTPPSYILGGKDDYLAFGALGGGHEDGESSDPTEKWKEMGVAFGKMTGAASGHFLSETMEGMEDLSMAEKLGLGIGAMGVIGVTVVAAAALTLPSAGRGINNTFKGLGSTLSNLMRGRGRGEGE